MAPLPPHLTTTWLKAYLLQTRRVQFIQFWQVHVLSIKTEISINLRRVPLCSFLIRPALTCTPTPPAPITTDVIFCLLRTAWNSRTRNLFPVSFLINYLKIPLLNANRPHNKEHGGECWGLISIFPLFLSSTFPRVLYRGRVSATWIVSSEEALKTLREWDKVFQTFPKPNWNCTLINLQRGQPKAPTLRVCF